VILLTLILQKLKKPGAKVDRVSPAIRYAPVPFPMPVFKRLVLDSCNVQWPLCPLLKLEVGDPLFGVLDELAIKAFSLGNKLIR
jgi:hypothetical protein